VVPHETAHDRFRRPNPHLPTQKVRIENLLLRQAMKRLVCMMNDKSDLNLTPFLVDARRPVLEFSSLDF